jgi:hypothetical protein
VKPNGIDTDVRILNRWVDRARVRLAWALSADFADYDEVFGERRQEAAIVVEAAGTGVRFRYLHPQLPLETLVWVEGPGDWQYRDSKVAAELSLERQCEAHVRLRVRAIDREDPVSDVEAAAREERVRQWRGRVTTVEAPGEAPIAGIVNRSMEDMGSLALLEGPEDEWLCPAAGIPLFQSFWARDSLTTALLRNAEENVFVGPMIFRKQILRASHTERTGSGGNAAMQRSVPAINAPA